MNITKNDMDDIVQEIVRRIRSKLSVEAEETKHYVYLSRQAIDTLFGKGYQLTKANESCQLETFVCNERVSLVGPKKVLRDVRILGSEKEDSQVVVSESDAVSLGIKVPIRDSGDISGTPGILIMNDLNSYRISKGLIIEKTR